jgi:hypothetical protein
LRFMFAAQEQAGLALSAAGFARRLTACALF